MKHKSFFWPMILALCLSQPLIAQREIVDVQYIPIPDTPESEQTPDSLVRVVETVITYRTETIARTVSSPDSTLMQRVDTIPADSTDRRGHYVEAYVAGGYGSLGYGLSGNKNRVNGSFSGLLQVQYAYFFHPNWGVGAGLWFTNYCSYAHWTGDYTWKDQVDTDNEQHYDHTATVNKWRERQAAYNLAIPISVQYQHWWDDQDIGLFASLGLAPSFTVGKSYRVQQGEIAHSGYYPAWGLTLKEMHEFTTKDYSNLPSSKGSLSMRPQVAIFADLGVLSPLTKQISLFTGLYFNCALNDANSSEKKALGWKDETFTFMEEYKGAYATTNAGSSHPWEVGVKVGIHWHHIPKPKHQPVDYYEPFTRIDTVYESVTRMDTTVTERVDTLVRAQIAKVAEEVEKFNKIYFALDSYHLTNKAKNYLSSIVDALNQVPNAKVSIDGHASEEGDVRHNEILAYNRAKAVANFLISKGLDKERVIVLGHGSLIPNEELEGEALKRDRRVEVKVVQKQSEIEQK